MEKVSDMESDVHVTTVFVVLATCATYVFDKISLSTSLIIINNDYLQTSDFVENSLLRIHSGLIQGYVPAADMLED